MNNIALVGPMHSGKTTAANYLVERYGYRRIGLADEVKNLAAETLDEIVRQVAWPRARLSVREINDNKAVFRPFLQWLGTDFVREYLETPEFWISCFLDRVVDCDSPVVCDDVRFPNEAEALRDAGFEIIRISRPEDQRLASIAAVGGNPNDLNHPSETHTDDIRVHEIWDADDIENLYEIIDLFMEINT